MSVFSYIAIDPAGQKSSGKLEAEDKRQALLALSARGLSAVDVQAAGHKVGESTGNSSALSASGRMSKQFAEDFARELGSLLAAGISMSKALAILSGQSTRAGNEILRNINTDVVGGDSLADAMARHPKAFSSVQCAMVRAGETGGFLEIVLRKIADFQAAQSDLTSRVQSALAYPVVLAVVAMSVVIFMLSYFIPRFSSIFTSLGGQLPALTRGIMAFSDFIISYGLAVLGLAVLAAVIIARLMKSDSARYKYQSMILSVPVIGKIVSNLALVRFCTMLSALISAGVPLVGSLRVAQKALGNVVLEKMIARSIEDVVQGKSLSASLRSESRLFPPSAIEMISVSEQAGRLDEELLRLAEVYQVKLDRRLRMAVALAEPVMLFCMAALVAVIFIGMLLPMFNVQDLIK